ncbi:MAG: hypothetical protein BGN88_01225 [Clostridiales bacterium 43-6]|nr:MAG: hypothetical protein BGN88_01225 [Clostridiales bacterium 43-6]
MKRIITILICVSFLFSLSSCTKQATTSKTTSVIKQEEGSTAVPSGTGTIALAFSSTDSLNPYQSVTDLNRNLSTLMFDSLIKLDLNYKPVYELGEDITLDDKNCTIRLKSAVFSDGTEVTAEDVTYSLKAAKSSALYSTQLAGIASYNAASKKVLTIKLSRYDKYFINLLDFPIYKMNSDSRKSDDNKSLPPIGSGKYIYSENGGKYTLKPNEHYRGDQVLNSISLLHTPDEEALSHIISVGGIDMYYSDLKDQKLPKLSGKQMAVPLTNFVYLGINSTAGVLNNAYLRTALSNAIDRKSICENSYYTYATPAITPFPQNFAEASSYKNLGTNENSAKVIENLSKAGYNNKDKAGFYINSKNAKITVKLLYNKENAFRAAAAAEIAETMQTMGINLIADGRSFSEYSAMVTSKNYELYLGEVKLNKDLDLSPLFAGTIINFPPAVTTVPTTTATTAQTTTKKKTDDAAANSALPDSKLMTLFKAYSGNGEGFEDFMDEYFNTMPFIPVCYRSGVLLYSSKLQNTPAPHISDIFYNIDKLSK